MIINRVSAENVLKYTHLDLSELPSKGLIAISGPNESGKSAIAETICFVLFGRTFVLAPTDIVKLIRWGESRCKAALNFSVNGQDYQLTRYLEDDGHQGARLETSGRDEPLARGVDRVQEAVSDLLGFGYEEFLESFYLAQRENTTAPPTYSTAVKSMAGVTALEQISAIIDEEIRQANQAITETEQKIADIQRQLTETSRRGEELSTLETERASLVAKQEGDAQQAAHWETIDKRCQDAVPTVQPSVDTLLSADISTSYHEWRAHIANLERSLTEVESQSQEQAEITKLTAGLKDFVQDANEHLAGFARLQDQTTTYRKRLGTLLGETQAPQGGVEEESSQEIQPFTEQQTELSRQTDAARGSRGLARAFVIIFALLAGASWAVWAMQAWLPQAQASRQLATWLRDHVPHWGQTYQPLVLPVGVVLTVLFVIFWIRSASLRSQIARLGHTSEDLDQQLESARTKAESLKKLEFMPLPEAITVLQGLNDEAVSAAVPQFTEGGGATLLDAAKLGDYQGRLHKLMVEYKSAVAAERSRVAREVASLNNEIEALTMQIDNVDRAIADGREQQRQAEELKMLINGLESKIQDRKQDIEIRAMARKLTVGACHDVAQHFNRELSSMVGKTLPLLTRGRYEHLQIDEKLKVRVFSNEKRNFMDLEEVSSGTQRQVMMAVRIALSQELVNKVNCKPQFIIMDEPFAFFDLERKHASLEILPSLSNEITQLWILSQQFPEDIPLDVHIPCARDTDDLMIPTV